MKILNDQFDLESFYARLSANRKRLLMLDYDGTLAPFTTDRDNALPYPEINDVLERLFASRITRVVIISGRSVDNLRSQLPFSRLPELWGCHGLERLSADGSHSVMPLPDEINERLRELYTWISASGFVEFAEFKPSGAALHWRGLEPSRADEIRDAVQSRWMDTVNKSGLEVYEFDGGIEIRVRETNKAVPVRTLIQEAGDESILAYLGDDLTDEDAFRALTGSGLGVLVRKSLRETAADLWISPPGELSEFLQRWL